MMFAQFTKLYFDLDLTKDYSVDLQKTCFAWSVWTLIISALDLILMCLLAVDYSSALSIFPEAVRKNL